MKPLEIVSTIVGSIALLCCAVAHIFTAWVCYQWFGTFWGIVAFFTPVISELVIAGFSIGLDGIINKVTVIWTATFILYGLSWLLNKLSEREN
jgi:hypothetical protein